MSRLAPHNTVLFASPPIAIRDVLQNSWVADDETPGTAKISEGLYTYIPPRWLPTTHRYPMLNELSKHFQCMHIRKQLRDLKMQRPILYIWHPEFVDMVGRFDEALIVYHCYDEFRSFQSNSAYKTRMIANEDGLLCHADIVFTASEVLRERRKALNANIHVVNSGVDYELFSKTNDAATQIPDVLRAIRGPIVGYVATQTIITDLELIYQIFTRRPDWSFVFIGIERPVAGEMDAALKALLDLPNIHFVGRKKTQEIPAYIKGCDVLAIPWLLNDIALSGSPLKLFEYFATGKPVISTPLSHLKYLDKLILFAKDSDDWIGAIERALTEDAPQSKRERDKIARENTWHQRAHFVSEKLAEALAKKQT